MRSNGNSVPTKNNKGRGPRKTQNKKTSSPATGGLKIQGSGDYASIKKSMLAMMKPLAKRALQSGGAALGGMAGSALAGPAGAISGASAGRMLASRFSKLVGSGDYATNIEDITHNSIVRYSGASEYASFADSKTSVRIRHREYLQDLFVGTTGVFSNTTFSVNPGLSNTFPFLSQIASNFEEYHMHGCVFEFVSTTSPYNSTSAMGSVVMAMEYNANNPPFTSKPQMENSDFAVSARPDKSMIYGVECANNATNNYYIRQGATGLPLTTTDIVLMNIATLTPLATGVNLGELWVSYDVELFRPHISPARYGYAHFSLQVPNATPAGVINSTYATAIAGQPPGGVKQGTLSELAFGSGVGSPTLTFANVDIGDTFYVMCTSLALSGVQAITATTVGFTAVLVFNGYTQSTIVTPSAAGPWTALYMLTATSNALTPTLTLSTSSAVTAAGQGKLDIIVTDVGNGLSTWLSLPAATL